jgi:acetate---CoA ligase (ADP-forming)
MNNKTREHWLNRLLRPRSIAIVGASEKESSLGTITLRQLIDTDYQGDLYPVNPAYSRCFGLTCYPNLDHLPKAPDLVIYAISGLALEKSFEEALEIGVGGIVIYASNYIVEDRHPKLTDRLKLRARAANIPVIGGNSMGFYNYDDRVFVSFDHPPKDRPVGHIGLILHSGSGMTYLANNDSRFCFNYVIASAQETHATVGDYMDFLLEQPSTHVIAIFLETVRDTDRFIAALKKANSLSIPVVITKLGKTEKSAVLAQSHSGAIIGDHDAFAAVCDRYGAILCDDADEMIVTAMLFAVGCRVGQGSIASLLDSGGMCEQMIDLADGLNLDFAVLSEQTVTELNRHLETGLRAVNPLDAMGALNNSVEATYLACGKALLDNTATALLTFEFEFRDGFSHYPKLLEVARELSNYNDKPVILVNSSAFSNLTKTAEELTQASLPVVNGIQVVLKSVKNLFRHRDQIIKTENVVKENFNESQIEKWKHRILKVGQLTEYDALGFFADFELPVARHRIINNRTDLEQCAELLGYPMVLKTAMPGITHKSECNGVKTNINDWVKLKSNYDDLNNRLGCQVLAMQQVDSTIELAIGIKNDDQYGPLIVIASGGIFIEILKDRQTALAPLDFNEAANLLDRLMISKLLNGARGRPIINRKPIHDLMVRFSMLVCEFSDVINEIDLNPVLINEEVCTIVDALIIGKLGNERG